LSDEIENEFRFLCERIERQGLIGFSSVEDARLLQVQRDYLARKLNGLGPWSDISAVSIGLLYHEPEILAIPAGWVGRPPANGSWNRYVHAYTELNRLLDETCSQLVEKFGGVAEQATVGGFVGQVKHVNEYFPVTVSHRAFAEAARVGWRGRHGLIVTPEAGPALRFATVFVPQRLRRDDRNLPGCGDCQACVQVCSILRQGEGYREKCRQRIKALDLKAEVCGICVRVCWDAVRNSRSRKPA